MGLYNGSLHTWSKDPFPAYANARGRLRRPQSYLQQQPNSKMVLDEYGHTDRPQRQYCPCEKPIVETED